MTPSKPFFAPQLYIRKGVKDVTFYERAFGAIELQRWSNDDGSLHVVELSIQGTIFHIREELPHKNYFSPENQKSTTVTIGLFVEDVDDVISKAVHAGATLTSPAEDYDYGYRQGEFKDPFGHNWLIEKRI